MEVKVIVEMTIITAKERKTTVESTTETAMGDSGNRGYNGVCRDCSSKSNYKDNCGHS